MSDQKPFAGRAAIVTGGTRGIGRAIVLELARRGADVAFNYAKSAEAAESLKTELEALGVRSFAVQCDVTDTEAAAAMVQQVKDTFGRIDYLVNNAGITRDNLIMRMREDVGAILNISSASGVGGMAGQSNYSASKAGMIGMTKAIAKEVASRNITV